MHFVRLSAFLATISSTCSIFSAARSAQGARRHIVVFEDAGAQSRGLARLNASARPMVTHEWTIIPAFAGEFDSATLHALRISSDVKFIEEDHGATSAQTLDQNATTRFATKLEGVFADQFQDQLENMFYPYKQHDAPWGLARLGSVASLIGRNDRALDFMYAFDATGMGVDIYVLATGIRATHADFNGRVRSGWSLDSGSTGDENGLGTSVAATAAGLRFGVAKDAKIIAVKIFPASGYGNFSDFISGVNWVSTAVATSHRASVALIDVHSNIVNQAFESAINKLIDEGVHVVVPAGNMNIDAGTGSPARIPNVITVGASGIQDFRWASSNWGSVVDIFAPGVNIWSAAMSGNSDIITTSGTQMSAAYVAGLAAYLIQIYGNMSPIALKMLIQDLSLKNFLINIPLGTNNYLAYNTE